MEIIELLKEYPKIGGTFIAIVSASLGWVFRNIFQLIIESRKYKREIKTFFWKEKINASKKASEFYLEQLNFLNLLKHQFEIYELGKIEHQEMFENIQKEVSFYSNKLKAFPHFEHHHINVFYDFNEQRSMEINKNTFEITQEIIDLRTTETDSAEEIDRKIREIKSRAKKLKENYSELFDIYKSYLNTVRTDIKEYV